MPQTIQFIAASSQSTLVAKLYAIGATDPAVVVATSSELDEVAPGVYVAEFAGVAQATYVLVVTDFSTEAVAQWMAEIDEDDGHFVSYEFGGSPSSSGGSTSVESIRAGLNGRWSDGTGAFFDLTVADTPGP